MIARSVLKSEPHTAPSSDSSTEPTINLVRHAVIVSSARGSRASLG